VGLFIYDHLGGRKILPATSTLDLGCDIVGKPLKDHFRKAYEYSDCWVMDSRLVVLNARDAQARGADIMTRTKVLSAARKDGLWQIELLDQASGAQRTVKARALVNAGGPWVGDIIHNTVQINSTEGVRLVRGSHIITRKLFDHEKCYFFQGRDGRIIFAIPYEEDFTLIGTTDAEHSDPSIKPECTPEEQAYLLEFASQYFKKPVTADDVVWSYSGVRPLYDDGASSASAATRDYVLSVDDSDGAPLLNVFGGKITTYRKLAEAALAKLSVHFQGMSEAWTVDASLPGGDFPVDGYDQLVARLKTDYPFLDQRWATRMARLYGTEAWGILGAAKSSDDLGRDFGSNVTAKEIDWSIRNEWVCTAQDYLWRRTKRGLQFSPEQVDQLDAYIAQSLARQNKVKEA
jgi:glycerol-3-phosphate dehydrogenase